MNIAALKAELIDDPLIRGYSGMTDTEAAADLNTVYRTKTRDTVAGSEILNATDDVEFALTTDGGLLTEIQQNKWMALCGVDSIDVANGVAKSLEAEIFGAGTSTRDSLAAVKSPPASRAVELGLGHVGVGNVAQARS